MRLILAAVLGGLMMFVWGFVGHMTLGLFNSSMKQAANESVLLDAMRMGMRESGFYFLPGMDMSREPTAEEWAAFEAKHREGPTAVIIYQANGSEAMTPKQLGTEFASNVAAAFAVGLILMLAAVNFGQGVIISVLTGMAGWLSTQLSYWNWYGFPTNFITAELIDQVVGWFLTGLVLAFFMRRRT